MKPIQFHVLIVSILVLWLASLGMACSDGLRQQRVQKHAVQVCR